MLRSRSSFELSSAVKAAASTLKSEEERKQETRFDGVTLVSFGAVVQPRPESAKPASPEPSTSTKSEAPLEDAIATEAAKKPPKLPDLSNVVSPGARCERIVEWIAEATGATDVFLADADGLPIAGAVVD